jgi:excisionase family DNA binding protein
MQKKTIEQRYLDVHAAAAYLGTTEKAIRYKLEARRLPFSRIGKRIVFDRLELDKFLAKNSVPPLDLTRR